MYELEGTVKIIFEQQTFPSGFTKREFVVTTEEKYPQDVKFECIKDRCSLLEDVQDGERVKVSFNIRGNEYKERYFVNLQAWRIEKAEGGAPSSTGDDAEFAATSRRVDDVDPDDDIPF